jgi:Ni2+-binding GTPase involved in maturation of urease and hydrogenase
MKLIIAGGFLGSGKTTAIAGACRQLMDEQVKVAVITNDQGDQQVDSAFIGSLGIPYREVGGGCFCCKYSQLDNQIQSLLADHRPEIIFAESVGSCTDLIATIARPMMASRPELEVVISVFADAFLLMALMEGKAGFINDNVRYIYKKQMEEADILVLNKADCLSPAELDILEATISMEFPGKIMLRQNSINQDDIETWLKKIEDFNLIAPRNSLRIDYDLYADGEAQLAWLDYYFSILSDRPDAVNIGFAIAEEINSAICRKKMVIGHLKFIIETGDWNYKLSFTTTGKDQNVDHDAPDSNKCGVLMNARVQTDPSTLKQLVDQELVKIAGQYKCIIVPGRSSSFTPGYPVPEHRFMD